MFGFFNFGGDENLGRGPKIYLAKSKFDIGRKWGRSPQIYVATGLI